MIRMRTPNYAYITAVSFEYCDNVDRLVSLKMSATEFSGFADFEWAISIARFNLKLGGLWPSISSRDKLNSDLRLFSLLIAITCVFIIPSLHSMYIIWGDMASMIDNTMFTVPLLVIPLRMLIIWWKKEELLPLITMIHHDWMKPKSTDERRVMIHYAQNARIIIIGSLAMIITTLIVILTSGALGYNLRFATDTANISRLLPFQASYIYDMSKSPQYELMFVVQSIVWCLMALSYTGIDNYLGLLIFHICGQLENLAGRLCQLRKSSDFVAALRLNVIDHVRLIRSVTIIEGAFTVMLLLLFLYFSIIFCIYGFVIVTIISETGNVSVKKAIFCILTIFTVGAHMCIYCLVGEFLVAKYEELYKAMYDCEWYTLNTNEARNLILPMVHTRKPLYITAGKILPVTMSTFCNILKTSSGYISVLLANQN